MKQDWLKDFTEKSAEYKALRAPITSSGPSKDGRAVSVKHFRG